MDCTVGKLISSKLSCLFACKIRWFEHSLFRATIFNILYAKISQNWYNKLSCVNERVHSWLMWPVNWSHRECNVVFTNTLGVICRLYTTATRCSFKWDVARPLVDAFFYYYFYFFLSQIRFVQKEHQNESSIYAIRAQTLEYWWLVKPLNIQNIALLFFTSIQFKCC